MDIRASSVDVEVALDGVTLASTNGVAWSYDRRYRDSAQIHGLISFFNERVDLRVDGVLHTRPVTPWSRPDSPGGAGPGAL